MPTALKPRSASARSESAPEGSPLSYRASPRMSWLSAVCSVEQLGLLQHRDRLVVLANRTERPTLFQQTGGDFRFLVAEHAEQVGRGPERLRIQRVTSKPSRQQRVGFGRTRAEEYVADLLSSFGNTGQQEARRLRQAGHPFSHG